MRNASDRLPRQPGIWKADPEDYVAAVRRHQVRHLLHYTPADNLAGIFRAGGLLSRQAQRERGLASGKPHGWGAKWKTLEDYVCVSFHPPLGLLRRERRPMAALVIRPDVIALQDTLFCPMNSARSWIQPDEITSRCDLESFEDLFREPEGPALRNRESEVLVRGRVELSTICRIVLPAREVWNRLRLLRLSCCWRRVILRKGIPTWALDLEGEFFP